MADALVMAGGKISGAFARATGTTVKALVPLEGGPLVSRVLATLQATPGLERICVVGPDSVRGTLPANILWVRNGHSAIDNLRLGIEALGPATERLLLCGVDLPVLSPAGLEDFVSRTPAACDIAMPIVRKESFKTLFPGDLGIYVRLTDGAFTAGGQYLVRPARLLEVLPLVERLFNSRKSQLAMAAVLGRSLVWKLITHRLSVAELEQRLSELTGCRCHAVMDCAPELSYDIDCLPDLWYIEKWLARR